MSRARDPAGVHGSAARPGDMAHRNLTPVAARSAASGIDTGPGLAHLMHKAWAAHQDGALAEADRLCRNVLRHDPGHFGALHLLGCLSHQRGRPTEALRLLTAAVTRNPGSAEVLSDLGLVQYTLERYEEALASHDAALAIAPDHPGVINRRAVALLRLDRPIEALAALDRLLAIAPEQVDALGNRGNVLVRLNRPDEAIAAYDAALRVAGENAQIRTNRAHALRRLDRVDDAVADLRTATALRPRFAEAHFELAMALLACGDIANGWDAYEWRWATAAFAPSRRGFVSPLWTGEQAVAGKTVLLHAEQGFGDTIQFARYVPLVARLGATVVLEIQPELTTLFRQVDGATRVIAHGQKLPRFDLHCPLLSLPRALRAHAASIPPAPHIDVSAARATHWTHRLPGPEPLIGIAWAGRRAHHNDLNRSIPLASLAPVLAQPGLRFVSLQRDLRPGDDAILRASPNVVDIGRELEDFADTAAVMARLDAVISVDTAVAHLAGTLARPLFLLLPYAADFRWLRGRDDTAWYPTARLLRQDKFGDWDGVVARLTARLTGRRATPAPIRPPTPTTATRSSGATPATGSAVSGSGRQPGCCPRPRCSGGNW